MIEIFVAQVDGFMQQSNNANGTERNVSFCRDFDKFDIDIYF